MKRVVSSADRRSGVILLVVIGMLTLFALVGLTFVMVADAGLPGNQPFQRDVESLASDTRDLAFLLLHDLESLNDGEDADLGAYPAALRTLSTRAANLRVKVQRGVEQSTTPSARAHLRILDRRLEGYETLVCSLRRILEWILRGLGGVG